MYSVFTLDYYVSLFYYTAFTAVGYCIVVRRYE